MATVLGSHLSKTASLPGSKLAIDLATAKDACCICNIHAVPKSHRLIMRLGDDVNGIYSLIDVPQAEPKLVSYIAIYM